MRSKGWPFSLFITKIILRFPSKFKYYLRIFPSSLAYAEWTLEPKTFKKFTLLLPLQAKVYIGEPQTAAE